MRHVFVYGTLRAGEINDIGRAAARHGITAPRLIGQGALPGRLYDFGEYPGMVPAGMTSTDGAAWVHGDIYAIDEALVPVLDAIEEILPDDDGLFRVRFTQLELAGERYECLYYPVTEPAVAGRPRIASGDWVRYRIERIERRD